ncbi:MAG: hypothetical protein IJQ56_07390 [Synergistaceae bacterium]|nr:hypothetical protein [Synergistaceae bacterium]MBR0204170.1 hypothetical protein [Synergistaceae bacterium]
MAEKLSREEFLAKMHEYEDFYREHSAAIREYLFNQRFEQDMAETRRREREEAERKGFKKGFKEARKKAQYEARKKSSLEFAKNLRHQGILSVEQIAKALKLPVEVVEAL